MDIESRQHRYFIDSLNGSRSAISVVYGSPGKWLRSSPDAAPDNNLQLLPFCTARLDPGEIPPTTPVRRNAATVTQEERDRLRDAIIELDRRWPGADRSTSWWKMQHEIHRRTHVHGGPAFLPWHRNLINRFEGLLQEVDPGIALHYWDWQTDPRRSPDGRGGFVNLFNSEFMGSSNGGLFPPFHNLIGAGVVRAVAAGAPQNFSIAGRQLGLDPDDATVAAETFPEMRIQVEGNHGEAHAYIGGTIGAGHPSFMDPFVFLLHSNVDRLFASWQLRARGDSRQWLSRLRPDEVYGDERDTVDSLVEDPDGSGMVTSAGISVTMKPWDGSTGLEPWASQPESMTSLDPSIVRPPLYDQYTFPIGFSWNAMIGGHRLPDGDLIEVTIAEGATSYETVDFVLESGPNVGSWKGLRVPDGEGSSWLISTDGADRRASVGLWAHQVRNGQRLIFYKAKGLGAKSTVYRLADLERLAPGTRVTFRWLAD
ncbi:tyrosinase family protein [Agromyces sp. NPDC058484]|uniref:tyrosinase family protein n=1 Tax=Agromyces sp. NPDC058484 TaxID=3346524 RepID=UPI003648B0FD